MRIYTRQGDKGQTGIHGGERVDKDDIRIEANGCLDELNSMIGVVRAYLAENNPWQESLFKIQKEMMVVMSHVATPSGIREKNPNVLDVDVVSFCESLIDEITSYTTDNDYFVLPGGGLLSSHLHMARTIARRAERRLCSLNKIDEVPPIILEFVNRLSDLFFIMARYDMQKEGRVEERWEKFLYKKKKNR